MRRIKVFLYNGILLTITGIIIKTTTMFFNVYISNKIGTEAIGIYQLILSIYLFCIVLANSGINLATTRIVSEQVAFDLDAGIKQAMKKCLSYSFFTGCFACIFLFCSSGFFTSFFLHDKISPNALKILAFSLPFLAISSCINGYFSGIRKVKKTIFAQIIEEFFKICLTAFLLSNFFPTGIEYTCISLTLGTTVSEFISFIFLSFAYFFDKRKLINDTYKDINYTKQLFGIALPISFTSYIRSGLSCLKQGLIPRQLQKSGLDSSSALSSYGIINGMVFPLIMFPCTFISSFSALLIPEFSYMNVKKEYEKMNFTLNKILKFCFVFSFLIMGFFWCFFKELNYFIYPNTDVSFYIKLLCPLIVLMYVDNVVDSILKGLNKQVSVMGINILDLITTISLIYCLIPKSGVNGYIFALFVSEILNGILSLILLIRETKLKLDFSNLFIKPILTIIFLIIGFSYFANTTYNLTEFIFQGFIFIISYFILLILFKTIVRSDAKFLKFK